MVVQGNFIANNNNYSALLPHEPSESEEKQQTEAPQSQTRLRINFDNMTPVLLLGLSSSMTSKWQSGLDIHTTV